MPGGGNPRAIKAGSAFIEFTLKDGALRKGLRKVAARMKRVGRTIQQVGAIVVAASTAMMAALGKAALSFAKFADSIGKWSQKLGIDPMRLQELQFAAVHTGVAVNTLNVALQRMVRRIDEAANGTGTASGALRELGLDAKMMSKLKPEEQFAAIADALQRFPKATQVRLAMAIFDTEGVALVNTMEGGSEALKKLAKQFEELGLMIKPEDIKAATRLGDAWSIFAMQLKHAWLLVGASVAEKMAELLEKAQKIAATILKWIDANRSLIRTIATVTAIVIGLGSALIALGLTFGIMGYALSSIASAIGVVAAVLGFFITKAGLAVLAIAGGVAAFLRYTEAGRSCASGIMAAFGEMSSFVTTTLGAIATALMAGDIQAATNVLTSSLMVIWQGFFSSIEQLWINTKHYIINVWVNIAKDMTTLWYGLQIGWADTCRGFGNAMDEAKEVIINMWDWLWSKVFGGFAKFGSWLANIGSHIFDFLNNTFGVQEGSFAHTMGMDPTAPADHSAEREARTQGAEAYAAALEEDRKKRKRDRGGATDKSQENRNERAEAEIEELRSIGRGVHARLEEDRDRNTDKWNKRLAESNARVADAITDWQEAVAVTDEMKRDAEPGSPEYYERDKRGGLSSASTFASRGVSNIRAAATLMMGGTRNMDQKKIKLLERIARANERNRQEMS